MKKGHFSDFVCLDEVTGELEGYNPVIYNPKHLETKVGKLVLKRVIEERFNGLQISKYYMDKLFACGDNYEQFIDIMRMFLKKKSTK